MAAMFKILGADGKEYGPVTVDQLKQWIGEGRANHETMALKVGEVGWKPLAQYADFAGLFPAQPPALPTAPVGAAPAAAVPVGAAGPDARARALQLVNAPAIALLVTAILGMAGNAIGLAMHMFGRGFMPPAYGMNPEAMHIFELINGPMGAVIRIIPLAVSVLVLIGALRMQQLRSRGLAMTAAIVAMIPCLSPCCLLGLPFGIWALIVLSKPEVQSQFDR
jgi:GYF domain 2